MSEQLKLIFDEIHEFLTSSDHNREEILLLSRTIIRNCSNMIKFVHRNELQEAQNNLIAIEHDLTKLLEIRDLSLRVDFNVLQAFQEYIEGLLFYQFAIKQPFPLPSSLPHIPLVAYILGLCDLIGELRRYCLDHMRENLDLKEAERAMSMMEDIFDQLFTLDYPSGLIPGVRKKTDAARGIVERTRGDLTMAVNRGKLEEKLGWFIGNRIKLSSIISEDNLKAEDLNDETDNKTHDDEN